MTIQRNGRSLLMTYVASHGLYRKLRIGLSARCSHSMQSALLMIVFGSLVIPAIFGSYFLIAAREQQQERAALDESLQRNADLLALTMQLPAWDLDVAGARPVIELMMRDRSVQQVTVVSNV